MIEQVDWLLFKLLILGGLADNYGNIWRRVQKQICVVECTLTKLNLSEDQQSVKTMSSIIYIITL